MALALATRLGLGAEGLHGQHRAEDLLADDRLRSADAADDRGREEEAALGQGAVGLVDAAALRGGAVHVAPDALELGRRS